MSAAMAPDRIVFSDRDADPAGIVHALPPFMIGLTAAVVGVTLLVPGFVSNGPLVVNALLLPSLVACAMIYAWSVLYPGDVVGLVVDRRAGTIELMQANAFAMRRTSIAFDAIARVSAEPNANRAGDCWSACIMLGTGERLPVAFEVDEGRLIELQQAIHLTPHEAQRTTDEAMS